MLCIIRRQICKKTKNCSFNNLKSLPVAFTKIMSIDVVCHVVQFNNLSGTNQNKNKYFRKRT